MPFSCVAVSDALVDVGLSVYICDYYEIPVGFSTEVAAGAYLEIG